MTISVVADPPGGSHAAPSRIRRPGAPKPAVRPTIAVTVHLTLDDDVANPAAALRALVEHLGAIGHLAVTAGPPRLDPHPVVQVEAALDRETIRLDARSRTVCLGRDEIPLCRREFDLLLYLAEHPGQVFTRGQLLSAVWGDVFTGPRTVDVHIRRLRSKLGVHRPLITTVRGVGYRLATGAPIAVVRTPPTAPHLTGPTSMNVNLPAGSPPAHRGAA